MPKKKPAVDRITPALAPFGFPHPPGPGLCFRPEDDERLARGFPHLRMVTDEPPPPKLHQVVLDALDAIDPALRLHVPRELARLYLLGYSVGPCLFAERDGVGPMRAEREALVRSDREPDLGLLAATLDRVMKRDRDTYGRWRYGEVLSLYEHFLGTDQVAETVAGFLLEVAAGSLPSGVGRSGSAVAKALGWMLRRTSAEATARVRARLATAPPASQGTSREQGDLLAELAWLADPSGFDPGAPRSLQSRFIAHDAEFLRARLERLGNPFEEPATLVWVLGTAHLAGPISVAGQDLPALVDQLGVFRDPGVVRVLAYVATQRAGAAAAGPWFQRHAAYARPILLALQAIDDPKEQKAVAAALALVDAAVPVPAAPPEPLTEDEVEARIAALFAELGPQLRAKSTPAARKKRLLAAFERYTEIRAAGGDPTPEAYFTHRFGDFDLGEFAMLAVEALQR